MLAQHGREIKQRVFVADLEQIWPFVPDDPGEASAGTEILDRPEKAITPIECWRRRGAQVIDAAISSDILDVVVRAGDDEAHLPLEVVCGLQQRTTERADAARRRVICVRQMNGLIRQSLVPASEVDADRRASCPRLVRTSAHPAAWQTR